MVDDSAGAKGDSGLAYELDFLFEAGYLKRLRRSGWQLAGIANGESVAEHVFRTSVVGFVLACLEGVDPYRVATLCLLHDMQETRVSDLNPVTKKYFDQDAAEATARGEVCNKLDRKVSHHLKQIFDQYEARSSPEAVVARDADLLECILQAYEYREMGFQGVANFIAGQANLQSQLKLTSAVRLAELAATRSSTEWWKALTQGSSADSAENDQ